MEVPITCPCPPKGGAVRHPKGDRVVLRDKLGSHESLTIRKAIALAREEADGSGERGLAAEILATLSEFYILMGVESWTFEDAEGKPLSVSKANIRSVLLESPDIDLAIEAADTLYNEAILLPLLNRASPSSPPTPTPSQEPESSTSARTESPTKPQKQSRPSSTTTSPTDGTETTTLSLVGGSSSSQNSQSAA
jgi:hypothetical protein